MHTFRRRLHLAVLLLATALTVGRTYAQAPPSSAAPDSSSARPPHVTASTASKAAAEGVAPAATASVAAPATTASPSTTLTPGPRLVRPGSEAPDAGEVPAGYRLETRPRKAVVAAGSIGFGAGWLSAATAGSFCILARRAAESGADISHCVSLLIPFAGPLVFIGTGIATVPAGAAGSVDPGWMTFLSINAAVQIAGAAVAIVGLAVPEKRLVREEPVTPQVTVVPMIDQRTGGLSLVGRF